MKLANLIFFFYGPAEAVVEGGGEVPKPRVQRVPWDPRDIDEVLRPQVPRLHVHGHGRAVLPAVDVQAGGTQYPVILGEVRVILPAHTADAVARYDRSVLDLDDELLLLEVA